jgi:hypothetical protein
MQVNQAFFFQGDGMHNSAILLPELLEDGIRLLVYAGNADGMCNFIVCHMFCYSVGGLCYVLLTLSVAGQPRLDVGPGRPSLRRRVPQLDGRKLDNQ